MKIETRVEALELELKILKAEIQSTLLEIREQVLNHYYPELRAEEPQRAKLGATKPAPQKGYESRSSKGSPDRDVSERGQRNSRQQGDAKQTPPAETKMQIQPFSDIFLQDLDDADDDLDIDYVAPPRRLNTIRMDTAIDDDDDDDELDIDELEDVDDITPPSRSAKVTPKTREVDFQQLKQAPTAQKPTVKPRVEKVEIKEPKSNRRNFAALAAWVGDSIAKVGKERTIQVVETYGASGGALSSEMKSSILQLASLANDAEPTSPVGNQEMLSLMVTLDQVLGEQ